MLPKRDFLGTQAQPLGIRSQCPPPPQPCGKTIIANFAFWRWHHAMENFFVFFPCYGRFSSTAWKTWPCPSSPCPLKIKYGG